jgi:hypothetical protein
MTKQIRKDQKKLNQINRELLKLDKKLQKMETGMAVLPPDTPMTEQKDKEDNTDE